MEPSLAKDFVGVTEFSLKLERIIRENRTGEETVGGHKGRSSKCCCSRCRDVSKRLGSLAQTR